jgi:hypothetical protein
MAWIKNSDIRDGVVTSSKLGALAVTAAKLALAIVGGSHMVAGALKIVTAAGAAAGDVTVTGIAADDKLICVLRLDRDATAANINLSTLTDEFTIASAGTINNASGTNTTGDTLVVAYWDVSVT